MTEFSHVISLGARCYTALDLELLNLRDTSSPFDWLLSSWRGVEKAFTFDFDMFLELENLIQCKQHAGWYLDEAYHFEFRHDFSPYRPLKSQYKKVSEKYQRRISRFLNNICEPTLFIRYIETDTELQYISENYSSIVSSIKRRQTANEIIFVSHLAGVSDIQGGYYVQTTSSYSVHPITDCPELKAYLISLPYGKRQENAVNRQQRIHRKSPCCLKLVRWVKIFKMKYFPRYHFMKQYSEDDFWG